MKQASLAAAPLPPFLLLFRLLTLDAFYLLSWTAAPCLPSAAVTSHYGRRQNSAGTSQGYPTATELLQEPPPGACSKGSDCPEACRQHQEKQRSLLKKWSRLAILKPRYSCITTTDQSTARFCSEIDECPESFVQNALAEDFKTFLRWTLDHYPRVRASESLNQYWRVLNMHILEQSGRKLDDSIRRDVTNVQDYAPNPHVVAGLAN